MINKGLLRDVAEESIDFLLNIDESADIPLQQNDIPNNSTTRCSIGIFGKQEYVLVMHASGDAIYYIASHVFSGSEVPISLQQTGSETLAELTNIIAGRIVDHLKGDFRLSTPLTKENTQHIKLPVQSLVAEVDLECGIYLSLAIKRS